VIWEEMCMNAYMRVLLQDATETEPLPCDVLVSGCQWHLPTISWPPHALTAKLFQLCPFRKTIGMLYSSPCWVMWHHYIIMCMLTYCEVSRSFIWFISMNPTRSNSYPEVALIRYHQTTEMSFTSKAVTSASAFHWLWKLPPQGSSAKSPWK